MAMNRPGLAGAYVPSTPGMASVLQEARREDEQRHREHDQQHHQQEAQR